jgi:hypothetical protein
MSFLKRLVSMWREVVRMPSVTVSLRCEAALENDPFYLETTRAFHQSTRRRHRKFPLIRSMEYGVALCVLPERFDDYFMMIDAAARRNYKKATRLGYRFEKIDYNQYLDDIREVRRSTPERQGRQLPSELIRDEVEPCRNPPTRTAAHDYPHFGILREGRVVAYAGCLIAGEVCMLEHMLGHVAKQSDGIVPLLIVDIARFVMDHHPDVKYYAYGTYFGAGTTMRRFKRKFRFMPHKVHWALG